MPNRTVTAELEMKGKDATGPAFKSITARMGQMEKQFSRFNRTAEQFNSKIKNIERSTGAFAKVSRGIETTTGMLMTGLKGFGAYAVASGVKQAVVSFADMERHMTRIGITAEASKTEVADATKEIERMSRSMGYSNFEPAMTALDTLVSSGMDLKTAMAFLPSVMATAQASGAETEDIANAGLKTASAFKLQASEMQKAFDDMAFSGKQGQFELKDMAQYIPSLASSFSALGYTGEDGLKRLLAIMQTIRAQTGTAEEANANASDVFGKMSSPETISKFKKFGVDLEKEMKKAKKNGEDVVDAFVRLAKEAVHGDLSKLPQLFGDKQARLGMLALINGADELKKQLEALNNTRVSGTVLRDLNTVLEDTQAKLDRFAVSWDKYMKNVGGAAAGPIGKVLDIANNTMERGDAITAGIAKSGMSEDEKTKYYIARGQGGSAEADRLDRYFAFLGDPNNEQFRAAYMADFADTPQMKKMYGRGQGYFVKPPGRSDSGYTPNNLPKVGPYPMPGAAPRDQHLGEVFDGMGGRISPPSAAEYMPTTMSPNNPAAIMQGYWDAVDLEEKSQQAGQSLGQTASEKLQGDAPGIGEQIGNAILSILSSWKPNINISGYSGNQGVNANVGKPATVTPPAGMSPRKPDGGGW